MGQGEIQRIMVKEAIASIVECSSLLKLRNAGITSASAGAGSNPSISLANKRPRGVLANTTHFSDLGTPGAEAQ